MIRHIGFIVLMGVLAGLVGGFLVLVVAAGPKLAIGYPVIILGIGTLVAFTYHKRIGVREWRFPVAGSIAVIAGGIASISVVLVEQLVHELIIEGGVQGLTTLPIPAYVHWLLFAIIMFVPAIFFHEEKHAWDLEPKP